MGTIPEWLARHRLAPDAPQPGGAPGLFLAEGADWRDQRRMVMAGFAAPAIKAYFAGLLAVAQRLLRRWEKAVQAGGAIELTT